MKPGIVDLICSAIAKQEGWFDDVTIPNRPQRNNNPGDLRAAPWLQNFKSDTGYWKADSAGQGIAGLYHQVWLNVARGYSLRKLINVWAPATDGNDPKVYLDNVMKITGITNPDQVIWDLINLCMV